MDKRNRRRVVLSGRQVGIAMAFFSPCNYQTPRTLFVEAVSRALSVGVAVAVAQATLPGQAPQPVPDCARHRVYEDADVLFYKENLWNLAVDLLPDCDAFVFLDSDIRLTDGWLAGVVDVLNESDVCQPFSRSRWLHRDGRLDKQMKSSAYAIQNGEAPWPHRYHPGFGIGITRVAYEKIDGIYERVPSGGGDMAFWLAMSQHKETETIIRSKSSLRELNVSSPSYIQWRSRVMSCGLKVSSVQNVTATHYWHGDRTNRMYTTREEFFPKHENGEPAVERRPDGLLKYTRPAPMARDYFVARQEDG